MAKAAMAIGVIVLLVGLFYTAAPHSIHTSAGVGPHDAHDPWRCADRDWPGYPGDGDEGEDAKAPCSSACPAGRVDLWFAGNDCTSVAHEQIGDVDSLSAWDEAF